MAAAAQPKQRGRAGQVLASSRPMAAAPVAAARNVGGSTVARPVVCVPPEPQGSREKKGRLHDNRGSKPPPEQQASGSAGYSERAKRNYRGKRGGAKARARAGNPRQAGGGGKNQHPRQASGRQDPTIVATQSIVAITEAAVKAIDRINARHMLATMRKQQHGRKARPTAQAPQQQSTGAAAARGPPAPPPPMQHAPTVAPQASMPTQYVTPPPRIRAVPLYAQGAQAAAGAATASAVTPTPARTAMSVDTSDQPVVRDVVKEGLAEPEQVEMAGIVEQLGQCSGDMRRLSPSSAKRLRDLTGAAVRALRISAGYAPPKD